MSRYLKNPTINLAQVCFAFQDQLYIAIITAAVITILVQYGWKKVELQLKTDVEEYVMPISCAACHNRNKNRKRWPMSNQFSFFFF